MNGTSAVVALEPRPGRERPRISVSKLAEYLTATPGRRRRIIHEQKYPQPFIVSRYREAERAMIDYLSGDEHAIERCRERFVQMHPDKDAEAQRIENGIEALCAFEDSIEVLDATLGFDGLTVGAAPHSADRLEYAGVSVSVRPEFILARRDRRPERAGCLKLYLVKTAPLDDAAGQYVSTVLAEFADRNLTAVGEIDRRMIVTLDVFSRKAFAAPKARSRRLDDITAACEEIAARWASI